jgi:hypothetical protein
MLGPHIHFETKATGADAIARGAGLEILSSLQLPCVIEGADDHIVVATAHVRIRARWSQKALANFGEDIGAMMALVDRALALNPNYAQGWHVSGFLRLQAAQPEIAIEHLETSLRLSPRVRIGASHLAGCGKSRSVLFSEQSVPLSVAVTH